MKTPAAEKVQPLANSQDSSITAETNKPVQIQVKQPQLGSIVQSPLSVAGKARGTWFFEGQFSIVLRSEGGQPLARGTAEATTNWMTEKLVPFRATLAFSSPAANVGVLVFYKANPSGLAAQADSLSIPVRLQEEQ